MGRQPTFRGALSTGDKVMSAVRSVRATHRKMVSSRPGVRSPRNKVGVVVRGMGLFVAALLTTIFVMSPAQGAQGATPRVTGGVLDLADRTLTDAPVSLEGEWEFYRGHLYDPEVFVDVDGAPPPAYFPVPGGWKDFGSGVGFGTYRLRIRGLEADEPLALYVPFVPTSHALWVNGRLVATQGVVATDGADAVPSAGTAIVPIAPGVSDIEIVLHVANFSFREGGIARNLVLGTYEDVRGNVQRSLVLASFFAASLLFIGLYHVGLWAMRRQDRQLLWFGLLSVAIALRTVVMDQAPLTFFLPRVPWEVLIKVEYLGFYLAIPLFILFLQALFPEELATGPVRVVLAVALAFSLVVVVTPARIHSHGLLYFEIFAAGVFVYALRAVGRAVGRGRSGSKVILTAAVITALVALNDVLFHWGYLNFGTFSPLAVLGVLGAHSLLLSKQFSDEFDRQKELAEEKRVLLQIVEQHVIQIKDARRKMHAREEQVRRSVAELLHGTVQSRLLSAQHHLRKGIGLLKQAETSSIPASSPPIAAPTSGPPATQPLVRGVVDDVLRNLDKADEEIEYIGRTEIRNISYLLHPMLLRLGLVPALTSMKERFAQHFDVTIHTSDRWPAGRDAVGQEDIGESLRLTVYRIVEEALANVLKHASASKVNVFLDGEAGSALTVTVQDDGVGLPGSLPQAGFGFGMISARVEDAGGSWEIAGEPGQGTRLTVRLPMEADGR